ncbi:MAG: ABC transporter substrate-binding protein, partial [Spirochaetia bacterium]|nr:ABC transporter substrate-binding protein [Spirochaetia bacterium]
MKRGILFFAFLGIFSCSNNPYGEFPEGDVLLTYMGSDPKTLDPIRVGDTSSNGIASNIHDTPYEYHYLRRPLELIPSMAVSMPILSRRVYKNQQYSAFRFSIKKNLRYMDDVCFSEGRGREIKIDDLILSIKRAADTSLNPFGYPLLSGKVLGFDEYSASIEKKKAELQKNPDHHISELFQDDIPGVRKLDDYTLELLLTEDYPQIIYFFSLTISSPTAAECLDYYNGKNGRPLYDRHPASSGAYYLDEWHANYRIVLKRNPNYRKDDFYPSEGNPGDEKLGLLDLKGRSLPIMDEFRFQIIQTGP